jgi:cell division FtsZ-interacting protein ZapD
MSLAVAVVNVIYFAWTGDSLSSPRYGALTRRGHQSNPGGAVSLTVAMLVFAAFCYWMHRRQQRREQGIKKQS